MGHLAALLKSDRAARRASARVSKPHDEYTKDELWARLQSAEAALRAAAAKSQTVATCAHGFAQALTGDARRQMFELRDRAYEIRDAAEKAVRS